MLNKMLLEENIHYLLNLNNIQKDIGFLWLYAYDGRVDSYTRTC